MLSYYSYINYNTIINLCNSKNKIQRKVKPFNLYIDLLYTGTTQIIEANSEYIVMIPVRPIYSDKDWWMNKLQQIG